MKHNEEKRIYLDYAATTPVIPEALKEMEKYMSVENGLFGNPGSLHSFGQAAHAALESARTAVAKALNAHHSEILFFSSATEANNFAIRSVTKKFKKTEGKTPHVIVSAVEHPSILETVRNLEEEGDIECTVLPVTKEGMIEASVIMDALRESTALISLIYVQNEIGMIQNIREISASVREYKQRSGSMYPLLHTDASQAHLLDLDTKALGIDLMTISSHKMCGPKGASALFMRGDRIDRRDALVPVTTGGGQEKGMRSGTENIPAIAGFACAVRIASAEREREYRRLSELSEYFFEELKHLHPGIELNGSANRSPHILHVRMPGIRSIGIALDMAGIAASEGSACAQRAAKESHVLRALRYDDARMRESVRFSFGRFTTKEELDESIGRIARIYMSAELYANRA